MIDHTRAAWLLDDLFVAVNNKQRYAPYPGDLALLVELRAYHRNLGHLGQTGVRELPAGDTPPGLERGA